LDVSPDFGAVGGIANLQSIVGALLTFVLIVAVLMIVISGAAWALATANGRFEHAARARMGLWVACGATILAGVSIAWVNFLLKLGAGL